MSEVYSRFQADMAGRRVLIMGLGRLGRGEADARFLAEAGATVTVTDLADEQTLKPTLERLADVPLRLVLGRHDENDFKQADLVIRNAAVKAANPFLLKAREAGAEIRMDEGLFIRYARGADVVAITGTRGKTTATLLLAHTMAALGLAPQLGGNLQGKATLPLLKDLQDPLKSLFVLEMSSWQLQDWDELDYSPPTAVFTNFYADHMDYYENDMQWYLRDKTSIFRHQHEADVLVAHITDALQRRAIDQSPGIVLEVEAARHSRSLWDPGADVALTAELVATVLRERGFEDSAIDGAMASFHGVPYRRERIRTLAGQTFINDTCATTPLAAARAVSTLSESAAIIVGGKSKHLPLEPLRDALAEVRPVVVLLQSGQPAEHDGTAELQTLAHSLQLTCHGPAAKMADAVTLAKSLDVQQIVLSPAMSSFGLFDNEYHRGDAFNEAVRDLPE